MRRRIGPKNIGWSFVSVFTAILFLLINKVTKKNLARLNVLSVLEILMSVSGVVSPHYAILCNIKWIELLLYNAVLYELMDFC